MTVRRPVIAAMIVAALVGLVLAMPASAFEVIKMTGSTGDYGWLPADDVSSPAARCGYSDVLSDGYVYLRWIKVRAPRIIARDVTGSRDQQQAGWKVTLERLVSGGSWTKVASSGFQMKTTYDDASAAFTSIKVNVSGEYGQRFRAVVVLRWVRNGSVEGSVKARIEYYGPKWSLSPLSDTLTDNCPSGAK